MGLEIIFARQSKHPSLSVEQQMPFHWSPSALLEFDMVSCSVVLCPHEGNHGVILFSTCLDCHDVINCMTFIAASALS